MSNQEASALMQKANIEILAYCPEMRSYFKALNVEWITKYFALEPEDERVLDNPESEILEPGGAILFARLPETGEIVGTCALIKIDETHYELGKMGVTERARGRKIGKALLEAAIAKARALKASCITLETNSMLIPAINLYKSLGFVQQPFEEESPYVRADVFMRLTL